MVTVASSGGFCILVREIPFLLCKSRVDQWKVQGHHPFLMPCKTSIKLKFFLLILHQCVVHNVECKHITLKCFRILF